MIELGSLETEDTCLNCGGHVTSDFCRVFGDESDTAHACPDCATNRMIQNGAAAGKEVALNE